MRHFEVTYMYTDKDGKNVHDCLVVRAVNKQDALTQVRNHLMKRGIEPLWVSAEEQSHLISPTI